MATDPDRDSADRSRSAQEESERYRAAAEATLDQLDWCIAYLRSIRRRRIAAVLSQNRSVIREQLR
jgi:hypothetical protein